MIVFVRDDTLKITVTCEINEKHLLTTSLSDYYNTTSNAHLAHIIAETVDVMSYDQLVGNEPLDYEFYVAVARVIACTNDKNPAELVELVKSNTIAVMSVVSVGAYPRLRIWQDEEKLASEVSELNANVIGWMLTNDNIDNVPGEHITMH